jgi:DNA-binding NarL/FixJ family response regulator
VTTDPYWQTAERVCTAKQLEILELKHRHGLALRPIAFQLGISFGTVRDHLARAEQKIAIAMRDDYFGDTDTAA